MQNKSYKIIGMTMAIMYMEQMLDFYSNVFKIEFVEKEMYNSKLYSGLWGEFDLLFCPAEIARNNATQNRHQFDIVVNDLTEIINLSTRHGGSLMGEIVEDEFSLNIAVYDPDKNSILFKQIK